MIEVSRTFFWSWRPSLHLLHFGFDMYVLDLKIRIGHDGPPCRECKRRDRIISWAHGNPGAAVCPECCEHPDYQYEAGERDYFCIECGEAAPYEWIDDRCRCDDDCGGVFIFGRETSKTIGTPISELSGRPGHDGYDKFVQIAKSWGYD